MERARRYENNGIRFHWAARNRAQMCLYRLSCAALRGQMLEISQVQCKRASGSRGARSTKALRLAVRGGVCIDICRLVEHLGPRHGERLPVPADQVRSYQLSTELYRLLKSQSSCAT